MNPVRGAARRQPGSPDDRQVRGHPVAPTGQVLRHEVSLRRDAWNPVLARGDPVLEIHIPPAEPMPPAAVRTSLHTAAAFFRRYLPQRSWVAFSCRSWLFNPQLQDVLGGDANIPAWQREHYLYPVAAAAPAGLNFIFGFRPFDLRTAPRDTRLRRAVVDYLERGIPWRNGGMFSLPEDLPSFGQQVYLRRWQSIRRRLGIPAGS